MREFLAVIGFIGFVVCVIIVFAILKAVHKWIDKKLNPDTKEN